MFSGMRWFCIAWCAGLFGALACGPLKPLPLVTTAGRIVDPRCIPDASSFAPRIGLVSDAGRQPDDSYLVSDMVEVRVDGLPPCLDVDLYFGMAQGGHAFGHFRSNFDGVVSTLDAPVDGTWSVADPDGPLWSMADDLGGSADIDVLADIGGAVLEAPWKRKLQAANTDVLPIRGYIGVWGDLYVPSGKGPFPGLVVFGGSEGGLQGGQQLGQLFVGQGYVVLALSYFGGGNMALPANLEEIPLEYFATAIDVLKEHPTVRPDRIGVMGDSRGGEAALLLGSTFTDISAVVAIVPSGLTWPSWTAPTRPSWTFGDAGVAFVPWANAQPQVTTNDAGQQVTSEVKQFEESLRLAAPADIERANIHVEKINGPVLLLAAQDDHVWPSCALADYAWQRLRDAGHDTAYPDDGVECFSGAGHALSPANVGLPMGNASEVDLSGTGALTAYGGTPQGTGQGNRRAWQRTVQFLERALKKP